jgi:succinate dehydrogenase (ubiquinone) cytochrome b560 subunit
MFRVFVNFCSFFFSAEDKKTTDNRKKERLKMLLRRAAKRGFSDLRASAGLFASSSSSSSSSSFPHHRYPASSSGSIFSSNDGRSFSSSGGGDKKEEKIGSPKTSTSSSLRYYDLGMIRGASPGTTTTTARGGRGGGGNNKYNASSSMKSIATSARSRIGQTGVPEEYGQPKTGGTSFLGTPTNHRELLNKRPLSPDVLDVDGKSAHYKFPIVALSSITNRITGCVLSGAVGVGGVIACVGGPEAVPETVELFKTQFPLLVFPAKAMLSFPFVYHGVAGLRHLIWDMSVFGIDNENARKSSMFVFASSIAGAAAMASTSF